MASSNIKLFDENKGNMLSDSEFNASNQRLNGLQTGVASSKLQNKAMYQASLVAYAIAQVMMQNGLNANDTDAVSAFVANLSGTMLQKVYDLATTAEAQAGVATGKWMSPALVKTAFDKFWSDTYSGLVLPVSKGGTGKKYWDANKLIYASATNAIGQMGFPGANGSVMRQDTSGAPYWTSLKNLAKEMEMLKIATGSYVGTGTYGESKPNRLTFDFEPKIIFIGDIVPEDGSWYRGSVIMINTGDGVAYTSWTGAASGRALLYYTFSEKTVEWYALDDVENQLNTSGSTYRYLVIGKEVLK